MVVGAECGDGGGRKRTQPTVLRITPVLVVQHRLHNNSDSACGQRAERGQALLFLTLSSRVFTPRGRTCESETRDGGISLEIYGSGRPSAKPVTLYALRAALYVSIGGALAAARELEPRRAGVVPERRQVGLRVDTTMGGL
jgi:hypothetical protein